MKSVFSPDDTGNPFSNWTEPDKQSHEIKTKQLWMKEFELNTYINLQMFFSSDSRGGVTDT